VYLLNQSRPISIGFFVFIWSFDLEALDRFQNTVNEIILIFLLTKLLGDVTIEAELRTKPFVPQTNPKLIARVFESLTCRGKRVSDSGRD